MSIEVSSTARLLVVGVEPQCLCDTPSRLARSFRTSVHDARSGTASGPTSRRWQDGTTSTEKGEAMTAAASAVLGVDVGTASSNGVLVALDGTILRSTVREHTVQRPAPGHVEMDAEIWWSEFLSIAQELTAPGD